MILITYQSKAVLNILENKKTYLAKPSISFKREYAALIDMLNLKCACPVFAVVKGRKQNTSGRVSGTVKFTLNVPDEYIKYTEFGTWADFMYACKFSKPYDYTKIATAFEEVNTRKYSHLIEELKNHKSQEHYKFPQAILEKIEPNWVVKYEVLPDNIKAINLVEKFANKFRK
ncbi:MAG: hypothetical protein R3Y35_03165 [Clostridia bacterium]